MAEKTHHVESWLKQLGEPSADRDYKPGHQRMHELLEPLKLKQPSLRIRIAGTNGKGSTAFMLSHALQACGLKIGLYTSPHIHHFNERIRINSESISDESLSSLMRELMPIALEIGASYFEVATALALKHFTDSKVDIEILEAGVGARLDATTAVDADMALITPIGLDHQAWLGDTLAEIAKEKAHITDGCRLAISADQSREVLTILTAHYPALKVIHYNEFSGSEMAADYQQQNAALAWSAVQQLAEDGIINPDTLDRAEAAIRKAQIPGRMQKVLFNKATIWLDAAHNQHAVEALLPTLANLAEPFDAIMIFTREDRDLSNSIGLLRPFAKSIIGRDKDDFDRNHPNITAALADELERQPHGNYLVLGSFTTVAAALDWIKDNKR